MAKPKQHGFTIVEVLIVLAIAGLILLIVLVAVPELQKSSRNSRRKSDLGKFYSAIEEYKTIRNFGGRAPFVTGSGSGGNVNTAQFNDFRSTLLGQEFSVYNIRAVSPFTSHDVIPAEDEIIYFPWHYCQDGSGDDDEAVIGLSHDSFNYSVLIGIETGQHICLDNGQDPSDASS